MRDPAWAFGESKQSMIDGDGDRVQPPAAAGEVGNTSLLLEMSANFPSIGLLSPLVASPASGLDSAPACGWPLLRTNMWDLPPKSPTIHWAVNADGDWSNTANWSPARLPDSSDIVAINTANLHTVTFSTGMATVQELEVGNDNFVVSGGSLTITSSASFADALSLTGGTLALGSGAASVSGLFSQNDALVSGTGTLTLTGGSAFSGGSYDAMTGSGTTLLKGTITLSNGSAIALDGGRVLENQGKLTDTGGAYFYLGENPFGATAGGGTLKNDTGALINFDNASNTDAVRVNLGTTAFMNAGTVENTGTGIAEIDTAFTNTGTVSITAGGFDFTGGGSSAASAITVASGTLLEFGGGSSTTFTLGGAAKFSGSMELTGGTLNTGAVTLGQNLTLTAGTLNAGGAVAVKGALIMSGGTLALGSGAASVSGLFSQNDALVSGTGTLTLTGGSAFSGGSYDAMTGSGTTLLKGTVTLSNGSAIALDGGRVLENQGNLTETGGAYFYLGDNPFGTTAGGGTLKNDTGALINFDNVSNTDAVRVNLGTTAFMNAGTVENTGTGIAEIDAAFTNTGTVSITAGGFDFTGGGSSAASAIMVASGTLLEFGGSSSTTFTLGGAAKFSGSMELTGGTLNTGAVTLGQNLTLTAGTLNAGGAVAVNGALIMSGGTLALGTNTLTLSGAGSVIAGSISGTGTLALSGGSQAFNNGANITISNWTMSGTDAVTINENVSYAGQFTSASTAKLTIASGDTLALGEASTLGGSINGEGILTVSNATFAGSVASSLSVVMNGTGATLALSHPSTFAATISGFVTTDKIDLVNITATSATLETGDKLVVKNGSMTVATFQLSGTYDGDTFSVGSDNHGGTNITTNATAPTIPSDRTVFLLESTQLLANSGHTQGNSVADSVFHFGDVFSFETKPGQLANGDWSDIAYYDASHIAARMETSASAYTASAQSFDVHASPFELTLHGFNIHSSDWHFV